MARRYASLAEYMARTGTSQRDFAKRFGISQAQVSKIINGKQNVKLGLAMRLSRECGVPLASFTGAEAVSA